MHELSIALDVCRIAERYVKPEHLSLVTAVGLDVGLQAGIEVDNLEFCLDALLGSAPFGNARPEIRRLPGDVLRVTYVEVEENGGS